GAPVACVIVAGLHFGTGYPMPRLNAGFIFWVLLGGVGQIIATLLLVHLFSLRNFTVGTAYSRTEPAQAALFGLVFLSESADPRALFAIAISVVGVMLISVARTAINPVSFLTSVFAPPALIGLASGTLF